MLSDQLSDILDHLSLLQFEVVLIAGALVLLISGLVSRRQLVHQIVYALVFLVALFTISIPEKSTLLFSGFWEDGPLENLFKLLFSAVAIWVVVFPEVRKRTSEYYFLLIAMVVGSVFMLSANHLLLIYLAVELTSFAAYILTNFDFDKKSFEAGIKYLLFGGVSAAFALYGASLIYGYTGTLTLSEMDFNLLSNPPLLNFGILTFVGGIFFKISMVPFHIWTPAAYEKAPTSAVAILSSIPKIAALVLLHRFFMVVDIHSTQWLLITMEFLGILTIVVGTMGALRQTNAKRLIAYGAIAHSGFLFIPLMIGAQEGAIAFVWYAVIYMIMNLSIFYLLAIYEQKGITTIQQFAGLSKSNSYLGVLLIVVLLALIGLPPTAGFTAKFMVFTVMWRWYGLVADPLILSYLGVALISVVFSLFFYLKIPYVYFLKSTDRTIELKTEFIQRFLATIFAGVVLWIFFSPELLNNIAESIKLIAW